MPARKRTTVHLDAKLHRSLRLRALATDCTISEVVGDALRRSLADEAQEYRESGPEKPGHVISLADVGARLKRRPKS
ncbi:MAG: hypothetical protein WCK73_14610 [Deltaproteobacteria bacterium]